LDEREEIFSYKEFRCKEKSDFELENEILIEIEATRTKILDIWKNSQEIITL